MESKFVFFFVVLRKINYKSCIKASGYQNRNAVYFEADYKVNRSSVLKKDILRVLSHDYIIGNRLSWNVKFQSPISLSKWNDFQMHSENNMEIVTCTRNSYFTRSFETIKVTMWVSKDFLSCLWHFQIFNWYQLFKFFQSYFFSFSELLSLGAECNLAISHFCIFFAISLYHFTSL